MSVISGFLTKANKVTTNWKDFHQECQHFKQLLINNNYSNIMVYKQIDQFLNQILITNKIIIQKTKMR